MNRYPSSIEHRVIQLPVAIAVPQGMSQLCLCVRGFALGKLCAVKKLQLTWELSANVEYSHLRLIQSQLFFVNLGFRR